MLGKDQPACGVDNLTAICEPIVWKYESLDISQTYGPPWPVNRDSYIITLKIETLNMSLRF
jgi:hypothetical protein